MGLQFWPVSVILPIALGVVSNFATSYVKRRTIEWGKSSHQKKLDRARREYGEVMYYALHPDMLLGRMLTLLTYVGILTLLFTTFVYLHVERDQWALDMGPFNHLHLITSHLARIILLATPIVMMLAAIALLLTFSFREAFLVVRLFSNVRYFTGYVESIPDEIRDRDREEFIMNARFDRSVPGAGINLEFMREMGQKLKDDKAAAQADGTPPPPSRPEP